MQTRPKTKIFLDSGDPDETSEALKFLGFLDGQTTNPSLVAKNPQLVHKVGQLSQQELYTAYKEIIEQIKALLPDGSISIEVYADQNTTSEEMLQQARVMNNWIENPHIKLPTTKNGLETAKVLVGEGINVNMTLCFTQQQAAAVYSATLGAKSGQVFVSPFIGRLDDLGLDGFDLIKNISIMFEKTDHHVELLTASVRSLKHLLYALFIEVDIITVPFKIIQEWADAGLPLLQELPEEEQPKNSKEYLATTNQETINYEELDLSKNFEEFNLTHELTDKGIEKFAKDWNSLLNNNA